LLIGGLGSDRLVGNADDDILIAGTTAFDDDRLALRTIHDEWTSDRDYASRVRNLTDGGGSADRRNEQFFLNDQTVHDDGEHDVLTGSAGRDWFFLNRDGDGGARDDATDLHAREFAADLDFIQEP
jgi:fibronectin-binding autotransporter adhesin